LDKNGEFTFIPIGINKIKKYRPPSDSAIQFALKKLKPETYGDIQTTISTPAYNNLFEKWSIEEIENEIRRLSEE
jgi:hypothetical protein